MHNKDILCSVSTRGRYDTTLPLCLYAIMNQTKLPDHLIIFDDNENAEDLRKKEIYKNLFIMMDAKGLSWEVIFGKKLGQHHNHQMANKWGYEWVWRVDDDCIPDTNVLENLWKATGLKIGCVAGSVITPQWRLLDADKKRASGKIEDIYKSQNKQWWKIDEQEEVDHVHCTFLYRAGVIEYNLLLSKVAHREETLFSYEFIKHGYRNIIVPDAITYHLKSPDGGIRDGLIQLYEHDEEIFRKNINVGVIITLDNGIGDHLVFESLMPEIIEKYGDVTIACCYPEVFDSWDINCISIEDAKRLMNIETQNIYKNMIDWQWEGTLENAFRKLYL